MMTVDAKFASADAIASRIADGVTIAITGSGGGLVEPDSLLAAIERRFLRSGHPRDLTLVHAQGIGDGATRGLNRLAHEGLVRRVIGAHWTWSPKMQALAAAEKIEAYALPGGVIQHLMREIGAGRPGLITKVGLGSFVDPRLQGGRMNASASEPLVEHIVIDGEDYLRYIPFRVDVALLRGTSGDGRGNVSLSGEGAELDGLVLAMAARNCGGQVFVQVRHAAAAQDPMSVRLPGALVDAVVVEPEQMWSHMGGRDAVMVADEIASPERRLIAARAAQELVPGKVISFGFGIPDGVAKLEREAGRLHDYYTTVDHGHHGGDVLQGALFGFVPNGEAMIDSPAQFDFYSGGGIDIAMLGFGEFDAAGNVNVSCLGGRLIGPGGFIDIAYGARKVVFCGTFDAKGGALQKLVAKVGQITFPASVGHDKEVVYITERAVFRLTPDGVRLDEIAPGIDLQDDVLSRMGFRPLLPPQGPRVMQV